MKKTLKSSFALILALTMIFGSITAFAAEKGDVLVWEFYDGSTEEYYFDGELTEGIKTFTQETHEPWQNYYYDFDIEKPGFYAFSFSDDEGYMEIAQKSEAGKAYDSLSSYYIYDYENESLTTVYELEAGKATVGISVYSLRHELNLSVEYLGEKAEELVFTENSDKNLIIGSDIYCWFDSENGKTYAEFSGSANVVFSDEKTLELNNWWFWCELEDGLKKGNNTVKAGIFGQTFSNVITCTTIDEYVKDAQLKNADSYVNITESISGYNLPERIEDTVIVTLNDGSTVELDCSDRENTYITLPNGKEYYVYPHYSFSFDGKPILVIQIGGLSVKKYECNVKSVPLSENISLLLEENHENLKKSAYNFRLIFSTLLDYYDYEDFIGNIGEAEEYFKKSIVCSINIFVNYLRLFYLTFAI